MSSTSLGTLTLDLAVRLSEFTDGLSRAERETSESTENMSDSVRNFRDRLMEDLGGTPIGDAIDGLNEKLEMLSGSGAVAAGALAGMAIGGITLAAGALANMALELSAADVQLQIMATTANTSLRSFQVLTHAAAGLGIEQDALAGILADVQEKLGEFSATGGGGAADFFEALQNNTKMTDEDIRNLGKTLQGKDGAEAIQFVKDKLDALGATSQEQRFVFESLAGDLGNLMGLFADGGLVLEEYGIQLDEAGVIRTKEAIEQSRKLQAQTQAVQTRFEGLKTQLAAEMIPALGTLANYFADGTNKGKGFRAEVDNVGIAVRSTASLVVGLAAGVGIVATSFQTVGAQMRMIGQTYIAFESADGLLAKSTALAAGFVGTAAVTSVGITSITEQYQRAMKAFDEVQSGQQAKLKGLAGSYYDANTLLENNSTGLAINTVEAGENAKALEAQTKAKEKQASANDKLAKSQELLRKVVVGGKNWGISTGGGYGGSRGHNGIDLPTPTGTQVYAPESGTIKTYGNNASRGGKQLILVADSGKKYGFAHLSDFDISSGRVEAGMGIAKTGATGTRPNGKGYSAHLHLTVTGANGQKINPTDLKIGGDGGNIKYDATIGNANAKAAADAQRQKEKDAAEAERILKDILRRQGSITVKYATEREKIEADHLANVTEIKALYAEGTTQRNELLAREEVEYIDNKNAKAKSILAQYLVGEAKLRYEHGLKLKAIDEANVEDDSARQALINLQNEAYQKDLENFKFAADAKLREQDKLYQSIANSARDNGINSVSTGLDAMAQRTMSDKDYQGWRLAQDHDDAYDSVNNQYANRQSEINGRNERGEFNLPELERFELLELAKQEHLDNMWSMEEVYALKQQTLDEQQAAQRVAIYQGLFSGMTNAASVFFGENSRMHKVAFALEQAYAVNKALMNVEETYSNTYNSLSAIPLIGPYIAAPGAAVAAGLQVASAARIQGMSAPSVAGIAHGGLDNVPEEATYLLQKDERVLSPKQNKDLVKFMAERPSANNGGITINNNSSAQVSASRGPNGEVTVEMVDKMMDKRFRRIGQANSLESKAIQRGTTARVNRT